MQFISPHSCAVERFSPGQPNMIKTYHNKANTTPLIKKNVLNFYVKNYPNLYKNFLIEKYQFRTPVFVKMLKNSDLSKSIYVDKKVNAIFVISIGIIVISLYQTPST